MLFDLGEHPHSVLAADHRLIVGPPEDVRVIFDEMSARLSADEMKRPDHMLRESTSMIKEGVAFPVIGEKRQDSQGAADNSDRYAPAQTFLRCDTHSCFRFAVPSGAVFGDARSDRASGNANFGSDPGRSKGCLHPAERDKCARRSGARARDRRKLGWESTDLLTVTPAFCSR